MQIEADTDNRNSEIPKKEARKDAPGTGNGPSELDPGNERL